MVRSEEAALSTPYIPGHEPTVPCDLINHYDNAEKPGLSSAHFSYGGTEVQRDLTLSSPR